MRKMKKEALYNKKSHQECKKVAPLTRSSSRIDSQLIKLTQVIDNILELKLFQKLLQNTFNLRPIWDQWLKPFRNESNLKKDCSSEKFCQFDNSIVTQPVPHVFRESDSCKKAPKVTNHQMLTYYLQNEPWQR